MGAKVWNADATGRNLGVATSRCSVCGEVVADRAEVPSRCPFGGEVGCPLAPDSAPPPGEIEGSDPMLGETIAYHRDDDPGDGFPEVDDLIDRTLAHYQIGPVIGRGTMGRVYRAIHVGLDRVCAIKVMNPGLVAREPLVVQRFWAEARAVAGLVHPHVVTVHNLGADRGYHFIEMEHVPGGHSLKEMVVRDGPLDPLTATSLVRQVGLALGAAHAAGLVHRDVKPANILLAGDGRAKLADFGLVRRLADTQKVVAPLAGTPMFMAPELFSGAPAGPASDLYALGITLFYLLTARVPFASERLDRMIRLHRTAAVPDVRLLAPGTPDEVATILGRLLEKDRARRYATASDLIEDLDSVVGHLRDTEGLVRESLEGLDCFIQGGRDRFRTLLPVPGNRLQEVYVEVISGSKNERLLSVYSVCAPADPGHYEFALRLNAKLAHGGLSIREVNGRPMFVMARAFPRGTVTSADLRAAILEIARRGDRVEQELTSTDVF